MARDPLTTATLQAAREGRFYSAGPDRKDQSAAVVYDPTNGTFSDGDIVFR